jgi:carbamoyltransferase
MIIYGVSANEHDAALAVFRDNKLLFASHSERYSRIKNDPHLHPSLINAAREYGEPDKIVWYERPLLKRTRKLLSGQYEHVFRKDGRRYLRARGLDAPVQYVSHHASHAAGGFYLSPFQQAAILVVDAIGEWDTISIWVGDGPRLKRLASTQYPHSIGLLYSAFTQRVGLKPNEEEYILMGMAAYGVPRYLELIRKDFLDRCAAPQFRLNRNIHRGIRWWQPEILNGPDIAASIQALTEEVLLGLVRWISRNTKQRNLILAGGVALNCVANSVILRDASFDQVWISPDPGDAGSCIGAVAAALRERISWPGPYLGCDIKRTLEVPAALDALVAGNPIGVANGRAEFGPRALGNRSLLMDPRIRDAKELLNKIKKREQFRPFAPVILAQEAADFFEMPVPESPYMQYVARVKSPDRFPSITHKDGTARVQTLKREDNMALYSLMEGFYASSGCPMLLNTSLNIKGEPLVNTWQDAQRFAKSYDVAIF